jgi:hypothetical protein
MNEIGHYRYEGFPLEVKFGWIRDAPGARVTEPVRAELTGLADAFAEADANLRHALGAVGAQWRGEAFTAAAGALRRAAHQGAIAGTAHGGGAGALATYGDSFETLRSKIHWEDPGSRDFGDWLMELPVGSETSVGEVIGVQTDHMARVEANRTFDAQANQALTDHETLTREALAAFPRIEPAAALTVQVDAGAGGGVGPGGGVGSAGGPGSVGAVVSPAGGLGSGPGAGGRMATSADVAGPGGEPGGSAGVAEAGPDPRPVPAGGGLAPGAAGPGVNGGAGRPGATASGGAGGGIGTGAGGGTSGAIGGSRPGGGVGGGGAVGGRVGGGLGGPGGTAANGGSPPGRGTGLPGSGVGDGGPGGGRFGGAAGAIGGAAGALGGTVGGTVGGAGPGSGTEFGERLRAETARPSAGPGMPHAGGAGSWVAGSAGGDPVGRSTVAEPAHPAGGRPVAEPVPGQRGVVEPQPAARGSGAGPMPFLTGPAAGGAGGTGHRTRYWIPSSEAFEVDVPHTCGLIDGSIDGSDER